MWVGEAMVGLQDSAGNRNGLYVLYKEKKKTAGKNIKKKKTLSVFILELHR